jgi:hypothetical protein
MKVLDEGQRYRVKFRQPTEREGHYRVMQFVGTYLGMGGVSGDETAWSLRPVSGTSYIDPKLLVEWKPTTDPHQNPRKV